MADSSSNPGSPTANGKARLTEQEKKQNHILSEKKRRDAIRAGFDRICEIVPNMSGQGRSEAVVLGKTVDYMREMIEKQENYREIWKQNGRSEAEFNAIFNNHLQVARQKDPNVAAASSNKVQVKKEKNGI